MRILSWNLLRKRGARIEEIGALVARWRPDLVLMQETTAAIDALPERLGGHYRRELLARRNHGLAAWSPLPFDTTVVDLPRASRFDLPVPVFRETWPRVALVVRTGAALVANVHLDHGQWVNRHQLRAVLAAAPGLDMIIGDYNAFGAATVPGFTDIGPRVSTHRAYGVVPLRLDRCLVRGWRCVSAQALDYGGSDHRPILIEAVRAPRDGE